jgi:hypothetical protein
MEHIVANWALSEPQAALTEVKTLSDDGLRHATISSLAVSWAETNPQAAATLAIETLPSGAQQARAIAAIVQRWTQQDPDGVQQWVDHFPDGPIKQNAIEHIEQLRSSK